MCLNKTTMNNERKCILENRTGNILVTKAGFLDQKSPHNRFRMDLNKPLIDLRRYQIF